MTSNTDRFLTKENFNRRIFTVASISPKIHLKMLGLGLLSPNSKFCRRIKDVSFLFIQNIQKLYPSAHQLPLCFQPIFSSFKINSFSAASKSTHFQQLQNQPIFSNFKIYPFQQLQNQPIFSNFKINPFSATSKSTHFQQLQNQPIFSNFKIESLYKLFNSIKKCSHCGQ